MTRITIKEAANLLMASEQYVLDMVASRKLKAWAVHGDLMVDRDEVEAFRWDY
jgi:excisionase family DNA binding protein